MIKETVVLTIDGSPHEIKWIQGMLLMQLKDLKDIYESKLENNKLAYQIEK